ncbi:putative Ig domain-containing protein [Krasilnikovia cinnamomea]|uniref:putative Ig domain-containing protein n=1 Tax=Krasilnikovia cinnamomea TaxID=349313 RepID=UPI0013EF3792|nr:putative Ig domain-containing protein [Krasilnikovia cinnamomea]
MTALLAGFVAAPPAHANTAPVVANPGGQASPTKVALSLTSTVVGGTAPYAWSATGLPAGLSINTSTGTITGIPTRVGTYSSQVTVTDAAALSHSAVFSWTTGVIVTNPGTVGTVTGTAARLTMAARGGTAPYVWSATGLPTGLTISRAGVISGTARTAGTYTAKVTATDAAKIAGTTAFIWNVGAAPVVVSPGNQLSPSKTALSLTSTAKGGTAPYAWSATGLPAGLSIDATTGTITGTPTTAGRYYTKLTVTDARRIPGSVWFAWTTGVVVGPVATRASVTGVAVTATHTATGGTAPYRWAATGLPAGLRINRTTGTVTGTPTKARTYFTRITAKDAAKVVGHVTFTWHIGQAPIVKDPGPQHSNTGVAVSKTLIATGGTAPYTWSATGLPAGLGINSTNGVISGIPTAAGSSTVTVTATDAKKISSAARTFTWTVSTPLTVQDPGAQNSTTGMAVSLTAIATGGATPYAWSATGLPAGLTINTVTGAMTGTPTTAGTSTTKITVTDAAGATNTATFTWTVANPLTLTNPGDQHATLDTPVSLTVTATGGTAPYAWSAAGLPAGLTMNTTTGAITGTPTTGGSYTTTVTGTDAALRSTTTTFGWTVSAPLAAVSPGAQQATTGVPTSVTVHSTGGTAPYVWSATGLPAGLVIDTGTGIISGTPTTAGASTASVTVTDAAHRTSSITIAWNVALAAPSQLSARADGSQTVHLAWVEAPGATGYYVYRDDELVAKTGTSPAFIDRQLNGATIYHYQIKAVDAAAHASELSTAVTATTDALPAAPVNYARCGAADTMPGCAYTATVPADPAHPDTGGTSLTDGVHGKTTERTAWQGRNNVTTYSFTVDLGGQRPITEINSGWLQDKDDFTVLPAGITYLISADGVTFTAAAHIDRPAVSDANQAVTYRAVGLAATARYVKVEVDGSGVWTMTDEIEIRGTTPVGVAAPTDVVAELDSAGAVNVTWQDNGAAAYQVFRDGTLIATTSLATLVDQPSPDTGTAPGVQSRAAVGARIIDNSAGYSYQVRALGPDGAVSQPSAKATTIPQGSKFRVLQLNLCNGGTAGCYENGRAVRDAKDMILDNYPDVVLLQEICDSDMPVLATMLGTTNYRFQAVNERGAPMKCTENRGNYGIGIIVRPEHTPTGWSDGHYPEYLQHANPDWERRAYLCGKFSGFSACTTHLVNADEYLAMDQCKYLTGYVMPGKKQQGLPMIMGGDLNLYWAGRDRDDPRNVQHCVPNGYTRKGDDDVQHIMWTGEFGFDRVENLDWPGAIWGEATDHDGFLAHLTYYGRSSAPSPAPPGGAPAKPAPSTGPFLPKLSPASFVHEPGSFSHAGANGVAKIRGNAYYALYDSIVRYDLNSKTETVVAEGFDASSNYQPWVRASYGNTIFVTDPTGVYAVNVDNGSKKLILDTTGYSSVSVAGNQLFINYGDTIYRVDLTSASLTVHVVAVLDVPVMGDIAADANSIWVATSSFEHETGGMYLRRINRASGSMTTVATLDSHVARGSIRSVGRYLYAAASDPYWNESRLVRISKSTGSVKDIAGGFRGISGIESDGVSVYVASRNLYRIDQP